MAKQVLEQKEKKDTKKKDKRKELRQIPRTKVYIQELKKISDTVGLTPERVVQAAKNKSNPLHEYFNWDDTEAAQLYREQQARTLINSIRIIIDHKAYPAFESVRVNVGQGKSEKQYLNIVKIMKNEDYKRQLIETSIKEIEMWQEKYSTLKELSPIFESIDEVERRLDLDGR